MMRFLLLALLVVAVQAAEWDEDAPAWASEKLAKKTEGVGAGGDVKDKDSDYTLKPTVLADILVYDTKKKGCAGVEPTEGWARG
jgi:hypothetical protein